MVASEVRHLAQRSASASREIKTLITDSVEKVTVGCTLVDESGQTITGIMESVRQVSDIVAEISAASAAQTSGIDQVNRAMTQIDEATQRNAARVEEATAASQSMSDQTRQLLAAVNFFSVKSHSAVSISHREPTQATRVDPIALAA